MKSQHTLPCWILLDVAFNLDVYVPYNKDTKQICIKKVKWIIHPLPHKNYFEEGVK
jgi:hypothetical protein